MSLVTPIKDLKAKVKIPRPAVSSSPIAYEPTLQTKSVELEDVLLQMGRIGLSTKAQTYCHIDQVHELWCKYLADLIIGKTASMPPAPMPPEIRELIEDIAKSIPSLTQVRKLAERVRKNEKSKKELAEKQLKRMTELLTKAFTGDRRALHKLQESIAELRNLGENPDTVVSKLEQEMIRRRVPKDVVIGLADRLREAIAGNSSPDTVIQYLEEMMNRKKRPGERVVIATPRVNVPSKEQQSLAIQRLSGLAPKTHK